MRFALLFIGFIFLCANPGYANIREIPIDTTYLSILEIEETRLDKYKNDSDYNYNTEKQKLSWWENLKSWFFKLVYKLVKSIFGHEITSNAFDIFFKILFYSILGFLVFLIIKLFLNVDTRSFIITKSNSPVIIFSDEEDIIQNEDIPELIKNAVALKNYRLAIRYQYLLALKKLTDADLIKWEQQKTNDDYLGELKENQISDLFSRITRIYDFVWYGNFEIDEKRYFSVVPVFNAINSKKQLNG